MDVVLCPNADDVILCPNLDIELCLECEVLTLEGDNEPTIGETYTAAGGQGSLTFNFDMGEISTTATTCTITSIDDCDMSGDSRTGAVTVTDECSTPQTAEIKLMLPGGVWATANNWHHQYYPIIDATELNGGASLTAAVAQAFQDSCCNKGDPAGYTWGYYEDGTEEEAYWLDAVSTMRYKIMTVNAGGDWGAWCNAGYAECSGCDPVNLTPLIACVKEATGVTSAVGVMDASTGSPLEELLWAGAAIYSLVFYEWICP